MTEMIIATLALALMLGIGLSLDRGRHEIPDPEEESTYQYVRDTMSRSVFHAIRQKNLRDKEEFGDGQGAPCWPKSSLNGNFSLRRGVWVDDVARRPSDRELDAFRRAYQNRTKVIRYTLVEGEQLAPYGPNGQMIRVRATQGRPGEIRNAAGELQQYVPSVSVSPVDPSSGWWGSSFMGSLPCEMSITVDLTKPPYVKSEIPREPSQP